MRVIFSKIADRSFEETQNFLSRVWTLKEMQVFINDTEKVVQTGVDGNQHQCQKSDKNDPSALIGKNMSECIPEKQTM